MAGRTKLIDIAHFSDQLALMLAASVPIVRALEISTVSSEENLADAVEKVRRSVESGHTFSSALQQFRNIFGPTYIVMVKVGEQTGSLVQVLRSLAISARKSGETAARVKAALVYPTVLVASSLLMILFLVGYMLPNFLTIMPGNESDLPFLTKAVLLVFTNPLVTYGVPIVTILGILFFSRLMKTEDGRNKLRRVVHWLPGIGQVAGQLAIIRMCQNLHLLRDGGLDLFRSLSCLESETTGYPALDQAISRLKTAITNGISLGDAMELEPVIPRMLTMVVKTGEESGGLDHSLLQYTNMNEEDVQRRIDSLVAIIEPLTMAVMGIVVGIILIAAFLPTYQLMSTI
jgi:type IV pilus assembly protein PilC